MRTALLCLAAAAAAAAQVTYQDLLKADPANWFTYQGPYHAQRHSLLKQIHTGNVRHLVPQWIYPIRGAARLEGVPVVVDGVMYVTQPN